MKSLQTLSSMALRGARITLTRQGLILLSLAFAALLVVPGVSTPKASALSCAGGAVCLYTNIDFGGTRYTYYPSAIGQCFNMSGGANNTASSLRTDTVVGSWILFFDDANCNMAGKYIGQSAHANLAWVGTTMNDKISSFKIYN